MKLKDFIRAFANGTEFTITENAFYKNSGKYFSFRTTYFHETKSNILKDTESNYVLNDEVMVATVAENVVNIDVKVFIDIQEEDN